MDFFDHLEPPDLPTPKAQKKTQQRKNPLEEYLDVLAHHEASFDALPPERQAKLTPTHEVWVEQQVPCVQEYISMLKTGDHRANRPDGSMMILPGSMPPVVDSDGSSAYSDASHAENQMKSLDNFTQASSWYDVKVNGHETAPTTYKFRRSSKRAPPSWYVEPPTPDADRDLSGCFDPSDSMSPEEPETKRMRNTPSQCQPDIGIMLSHNAVALHFQDTFKDSFA